MRNASVLVAAHVDGVEHAFAARQLQLSIALLLNELASKNRVSETRQALPPRMPPRSSTPEAAANEMRIKEVVDA